MACKKGFATVNTAEDVTNWKQILPPSSSIHFSLIRDPAMNSTK